MARVRATLAALALILVMASPALAKSGPVPQATPVIAGLGQPYDERGVYHSSLFPYTVTLPWRGKAAEDSGIGFDRFTDRTGGRFLDIFAPANARGMTTTGMIQALADQVGQNGGTLLLTRRITFLGQATGVFSYGDGASALRFIVVAATKKRVWLIELNTILSAQSADQRVLSDVLRTLRPL